MRFKSLPKNTTPLLSQVSNPDLSTRRLAHLCHKASPLATAFGQIIYLIVIETPKHLSVMFPFFFFSNFFLQGC